MTNPISVKVYPGYVDVHIDALPELLVPPQSQTITTDRVELAAFIEDGTKYWFMPMSTVNAAISIVRELQFLPAEDKVALPEDLRRAIELIKLGTLIRTGNPFISTWLEIQESKLKPVEVDIETPVLDVVVEWLRSEYDLDWENLDQILIDAFVQYKFEGYQVEMEDTSVMRRIIGGDLTTFLSQTICNLADIEELLVAKQMQYGDPMQVLDEIQVFLENYFTGKEIDNEKSD